MILLVSALAHPYPWPICHANSAALVKNDDTSPHLASVCGIEGARDPFPDNPDRARDKKGKNPAKKDVQDWNLVRGQDCQDFQPPTASFDRLLRLFAVKLKPCVLR
jgi:hypothetical protein